MLIKVKLVRTVVLLICAATILGACARLRPIYEVHSHQVPATAAPLTLGQVEAQIIKAGASLGWLMKSMKPGLVRGTMRQGKHSAVVNIEYDTAVYSILYNSSHRLSEGIGDKDMGYEGQRVIHKRYNKYVKTLERQIEAQILTLGY